MVKFYSYVIKNDAGAAPNPFWGCCTLTICKPQIRKSAEIGDWVLGFGASQVKLKGKGFKSYSDRLVYAMKVTKKITIEEYSDFCKTKIPNKIPKFKTSDWRLRVGDCLYYKDNNQIKQRKPSVHDETDIIRDLSGKYSLLSNHFYYFGNNAIHLPITLKQLIHKGRGHKVIREDTIIQLFEIWIKEFRKNKIYGESQLKFKSEFNSDQSKVCF